MERIKIVFNGCFDLFHAGHKYIIHRAMDIIMPKDILIGLNSDQSVRKLKGGNRPVLHLGERADAIQRCIDEWTQINLLHVRTKIVPFDTEEELAKIIDDFEPSLIVKGNDRPDVREIVGSTNWPVLIIPRITNKEGNDISTSEILRNGYK